MPHLTTGNSAKLYCINWLDDYIQQQGEDIRVLDVGSGTSKDLVRLLHKYPQVRYVGIEPSAAACEIARRDLHGTNAQIINDYAYDLMGNLVHEPFDVVLSFSVMEHVVQRQRHLNGIAACMGAESYFLINYDAGHFVHPASLKERAKNIIGPLLAQIGIERYYQRFVYEDEFQQMVTAAGLQIADEKFFNTSLKGIHKLVPEPHKEAHMQRWLDYELWLNETELAYDDAYAPYWVTRNFILQKYHTA